MSIDLLCFLCHYYVASILYTPINNKPKEKNNKKLITKLITLVIKYFFTLGFINSEMKKVIYAIIPIIPNIILVAAIGDPGLKIILFSI